MSTEDRVMMLACVRWWLWTHLVDTGKCSGWSTQYWTFFCWTLTCRGSTCKGVCPFRGEAHSFSTERKWVGAHQITVNRYLGCWISVQELSNWPVLLLGVHEILWWGMLSVSRASWDFSRSNPLNKFKWVVWHSGSTYWQRKFCRKECSRGCCGASSGCSFWGLNTQRSCGKSGIGFHGSWDWYYGAQCSISSPSRFFPCFSCTESLPIKHPKMIQLHLRNRELSLSVMKNVDADVVSHAYFS